MRGDIERPNFIEGDTFVLLVCVACLTAAKAAGVHVTRAFSSFPDSFRSAWATEIQANIRFWMGGGKKTNLWDQLTWKSWPYFAAVSMSWRCSWIDNHCVNYGGRHAR